MKCIVTTTINEPTKATLEFCKKEDWTFIIVGDTKTPEASYRKLEIAYPNVRYLSPQEQDKLYPKLSLILGWKTIQRRNIGFVHAWRMGAEIIATVDDDNIPSEYWGKNVYVGQEVWVDYWHKTQECFDPLSATNYKHLWHRGFPIELLQEKNKFSYVGERPIKCLIQADLWNGDPDIDAICRLTYKPDCYFETFRPFASNKISPFNSQNTFLAREVIPHYSVWPFVGRMDDIWAGYYLQTIFNENLIYAPASVYQDRNPQDLIKNLENEIIGYRHTLDFIKEGCLPDLPFIPEGTRLFIKAYQECFQ